jgi:hypothetical protein
MNVTAIVIATGIAVLALGPIAQSVFGGGPGAAQPAVSSTTSVPTPGSVDSVFGGGPG